MALSDKNTPYSIPQSDIPLSSALSPNYSFGGTSASGTTTPATTVDSSPATTASTNASGSSLSDALIPGAVGAYLGYKGNQSTNQATNTLGNTANLATGAGNTYLGNALSGTLTPAQQNVYNTLNQQGATLNAQSQPLIAAGQLGLQQYQAGQLPAWQQQQLDNQTAAAIAQAKASLGANADSSTMAAVVSQIQNQAEIAKGQMLQNNLSVTQELFNTGITDQNEAFELYDAANTSVTSSLQQDFSNGMDALKLSDDAALNSLKARIMGDAAVSAAISPLFSNLTKATAIGAGQSSGGSFTDAIKKLLGMGDGTPSYVTSGQYQTDVSQYLASNPLQGTSTMAPADYVASLGSSSSAPTDYGTVDSVTYDSSGG